MFTRRQISAIRLGRGTNGKIEPPSRIPVVDNKVGSGPASSTVRRYTRSVIVASQADALFDSFHVLIYIQTSSLCQSVCSHLVLLSRLIWQQWCTSSFSSSVAPLAWHTCTSAMVHCQLELFLLLPFFSRCH
jgi:hypothetical protein